MDVRRTAVGGLAGAAATVVMTGWMAAGQLTGPHGEQPPKRLVRRLARRAGIPAGRHGPGTRLATAVAHLGFGALERIPPRPVTAFFTWAGSPRTRAWTGCCGLCRRLPR